ncbi:MAG: siderophore-interacting protein [Cryobacterium sp.]|nr:siderophore-interacting protein [Cryobacterium sp.]
MIERGPLVRHDPIVRTLTIAGTTDLSPGFRRITLTGTELEGFTSLGPADHVKILLRDGERRDYTPRTFRPPANDTLAELDIDFFLHGDGPAAAWAQGVREGDEARIAGPRGSHLLPTGANRIVLGADESSLPAFGRWIEMVPEDVEILGFVELDNPSDAAYLDPEHVHRARVVWLDKADGALERAIRALGPLDDATFVWVAGEATTLIPIRRYLRRELGLPRNQVKIDGYWKTGEANRDHHAPIDPDDPED